MPSDVLLQADNIRRVADDGTVLLQDVSLSFAAGSMTAIVGSPGSGKTLLLRGLGLLDPLQGGEVLLRGHSIADADVPAFRRDVLLVAQRPVLIEGTVRENLQLPWTLGRASSATFDEPRVLGLLAGVERDRSFLDRRSDDLSGGESQIVAIVRAIQLEPAVLLLDEPTSSLDEATSLAVETLVTNWHHADPQRALVVVSHTTRQVDRLAGRIVTLQRGTIVADRENADESA